MASALRATSVIQLFADHTDATAQARCDRRGASRARVLKGAIVAFMDHYCTVSCTVRNISRYGALVRSDSIKNIPDHFDLIIELDGTEVSCEVVWRNDRDLGVRFIGACRKGKPRRHQVVDPTDGNKSLRLKRRPLERTPAKA